MQLYNIRGIKYTPLPGWKILLKREEVVMNQYSTLHYCNQLFHPL